MRRIPVDTSNAMLMVATEPQPKFKNRETGEIATDRDTGASMYQVGVVFIADGAADVITVNVPEPGIPSGLTAGMPLAVTGLAAVVWEGNFGGQDRHGVTFRAAALTVKA